MDRLFQQLVPAKILLRGSDWPAIPNIGCNDKFTLLINGFKTARTAVLKRITNDIISSACSGLRRP